MPVFAERPFSRRHLRHHRSAMAEETGWLGGSRRSGGYKGRFDDIGREDLLTLASRSGAPEWNRVAKDFRPV